MSRHHELEWRRQCLNQKTSMAPAYQGASIANLYHQLAIKRAARERQARLVYCGLLPSVLALVLRLSW